MRRLRTSLRLLTGEKDPRTPPWKILRGNCWLGHAILKSGLDDREFASKFLRNPQGRQTNALMRWQTGIACPERVSALKLEKLLPDTLAIFDCPLFPLLADVDYSETELNNLMRPYMGPGLGASLSAFPIIRFPGSGMPIFWTGDSKPAIDRGDIWGLTLVVWAARRAETRGDETAHLCYSQDMYRALPKPLQMPWLSSSRNLLKQGLSTVRSGFLFSLMMFDIDWEVIDRQSRDPNFEPCRERRPRREMGGRFVEIEDPILPARIIGGFEAAGRTKPMDDVDYFASWLKDSD